MKFEQRANELPDNQASITIIAAAGESSSYGLPGVGQRSRTIPNNFTLNGTTWRYKPMSFKSHVGASKWSTRGWTYQEAVFSRRCVIFADDQVFYQCGCMTCAEELIQDFAICERTVFPIFERILYKDSDIDTYLPRSWRFMTNLEAYSKRELTYDSDVLSAMEGVFGFYAQLEPSVEQYWGLPLRWVGCQLSNLDGRSKMELLGECRTSGKELYSAPICGNNSRRTFGTKRRVCTVAHFRSILREFGIDLYLENNGQGFRCPFH